MGRLITTRELAQMLGMPVRGVECLRRPRRNPAIKLGYRTHRYDPDAVRLALERFTIREIGADRQAR